jgi:hypothetical protein
LCRLMARCQRERSGEQCGNESLLVHLKFHFKIFRPFLM